MARLVELRTYKIKPGARRRFHELVVNASLPLLRRFNIDVVAYGYSVGDPNGYYLIRSYRDQAALQREEEAFYGSEDWRRGPRKEILALIEDHSNVTFELKGDALDALRSVAFPTHFDAFIADTSEQTRPRHDPS